MFVRTSLYKRREENQLDATEYFIALPLNAVWVQMNKETESVHVVKKVKITLEQATKVQRASREIDILFL